MNQYFLLIACLQLWPLITPVNPVSTWGPLIFIFAVSASKEAWDDYNRYLSDKKANEKEVWVVKKGIKKHVWSIFNFLEYIYIVFLRSWEQNNQTVKNVRKDFNLQFPAVDHHFNNYTSFWHLSFTQEYNLLIFSRYCYSFISVDGFNLNQNLIHKIRGIC